MEWPKVILHNEGIGFKPGLPSLMPFLKGHLCEKTYMGAMRWCCKGHIAVGGKQVPEQPYPVQDSPLNTDEKWGHVKYWPDSGSSLISHGPLWPFNSKLSVFIHLLSFVPPLCHIIYSLWIYASYVENISSKDFCIHVSIVWLHFLLHSIFLKPVFIPYSHSHWMTLWDAQTFNWRPESRSHPLILDSRLLLSPLDPKL